MGPSKVSDHEEHSSRSHSRPASAIPSQPASVNLSRSPSEKQHPFATVTLKKSPKKHRRKRSQSQQSYAAYMELDRKPPASKHQTIVNYLADKHRSILTPLSRSKVASTNSLANFPQIPGPCSGQAIRGPSVSFRSTPTSARPSVNNNSKHKKVSKVTSSVISDGSQAQKLLSSLQKSSETFKNDERPSVLQFLTDEQVKDQDTTPIPGRTVHKTMSGTEILKYHPYLATKYQRQADSAVKKEPNKSAESIPLSKTLVNTHGYPTTLGRSINYTTGVVMKTDPHTMRTYHLTPALVNVTNPVPNFVSKKPSAVHVSNIAKPGVSHMTMQPRYNGQKLYYEPKYTKFDKDCDYIDTTAVQAYHISNFL